MKICYLKNFVKDKISKLVYIVVICFLSAVFLITCSFYIVRKAADKSILDIALSNSLEEFDSYELYYLVSVYSNKNINNYTISEVYKKGEEYPYYKFNVKNETGMEMNYEIKDNVLSISSPTQIYTYVIENYNLNKNNLFSISTFLDLYYEIKKSSCDCENVIYTDENDERIMLGIKFDLSCQNEISVINYNKIIKEENMNIKFLELEIDKKEFKLLKYVGYDENKKACFEIKYLSSYFS